MIESAQNPQIKQLRQCLTSASYRKKESLFVIESLKVAESFYDHFPDAVLRVYCEDDSRVPERFDGILCERVKGSLLAELSTLESPSGFCFLCTMPLPPVLDLSKNDARYLFLDGVRDPSNVGAILRSASAFGLDGILFSTDSVDLFHPKTLRAMAGVGFEIPILKAAEFLVQDPEWQAMSWVLLDLEGGEPLREMRFEGPTVCVLGSEGQGVSDRFDRLPHRRIATIPMSAHVESLNVAVTAGILCYELANR